MTEYELSEKVKSGNRQAFGVLYRQYAPALFRVLVRYLANKEKAEDLLHDSFIKIFDKITLFEYQGEGSLEAWLTRLCVNESLMLLRKEKRIPTISMDDRDDLELQAALKGEPEEADVDRIPAEVLESMVASLPDGYRTVLLLFLYEGKSHREIAQMLGINEKSSSSQLARAKKLLARQILAWQKEN